ncbi:hypothetical protein QUF58_06185 [Anaerolineales bacterium HSG24]|nr:hypothetical protein [Anaerolineales bacterium HSG24]
MAQTKTIANTPIITALFTSLLFNIPLLLIWGGIGVVAVVRWQGGLILWDYVGDPDSLRYQDFKKRSE